MQKNKILEQQLWFRNRRQKSSWWHKIYYIYGFSLTSKHQNFYIESVARESEEPFLLNEKYKANVLEVVSRAYKPLLMPYSTYNLTIFRGNLQMEIPFEIFVMHAKHSENAVFLHGCKLSKKSGKLEMQHTKILWIEGAMLQEIVFYKNYFNQKYQIKYFNIEGFQANKTNLCDQFMIYFTGCQTPKIESHIVALILGLMAIFVFITCTWCFGLLKSYRKSKREKRKARNRKKEKVEERSQKEVTINTVYKPQDTPTIIINWVVFAR